MSRLVLATVLSLLAHQALAHVTLEPRQATIGSNVKVTLRVPHGCAGAAMLRLRAHIPDGVLAKPMPHAGWVLRTVKAAAAAPFATEHGAVSETVREVSWEGRLPDDNYDEFAMLLTLTSALKPDAQLYIPVVQECEGGEVARWIETPAGGQSASDLKAPAPSLKLLPKP